MNKARMGLAAAFLALVAVAFGLAGMARAEEAAKATPPMAFDQPPPEGTMARCPVMGGGEVKVTKDTPHSEYQGKHYYFCCPHCKEMFDKDPAKYVSAASSPKAGAPKSFDKEMPVGTAATCPVMGGEFKIAKDTEHSEYKGKHYYFCCAGCKPKFDADPEKYSK